VHNNIMKKLSVQNRTAVARVILLGALAMAAFGQSQIQVVLDPSNPAPLAPGAVVLDVQLLNPPAPAPSGLQFSVSLPAGATASGALAGALVGSGKQLQCVTLPPTFSCLIVGTGDANPIPAGVTIAKVTLVIPAGSFSLGITKPVLSDPTGATIAVTAGVPLALAIPLSACDLNGDGVVSLADIQIAINQALGKDQGGNITACGSADLTKDGACNVLDVQRVVDAAIAGGSCKVGQ
jgi:hypothetical protein